MTIAPAVVAAIGAVSTVVGTGVSVVGAAMQASSQKKIEQLRQRQMELESQRQQREIIRQRVIANSQAVAAANSQGAIDSSGMSGGIAQVTNQAGRSLLANSQNLAIGEGIFKANASADQGGTLASIGNGLSSLGGSIMQNYQMLSRISGYNPNVMGYNKNSYPSTDNRYRYNDFPE